MYIRISYKSSSSNGSSYSPFQKLYTDFELQGVIEENLNSKTYQTVSTRMQTEEATCALTMGMRCVHERVLSKLLFNYFTLPASITTSAEMRRVIDRDRK